MQEQLEQSCMDGFAKSLAVLSGMKPVLTLLIASANFQSEMHFLFVDSDQITCWKATFWKKSRTSCEELSNAI